MKKLSLISILMSALVTFSSFSSSSIKNPKKIGGFVIKVLKRLPESNVNEFAENYISLATMNEIGKSDELVTKSRERIKLRSFSEDDYKEYYKDKISSSYESLKEKAIMYDIDWPSIEMQSFSYKVEYNHYVKGCSGVVIFKSNDKLFSVKVFTYYDGKKYHLVGMGDLREHSN